MLEQTINRMKATHTVNALEAATDDATSTFLEKIERNIGKLHAESRQGLWNIAVFMVLSIVALLCRDINIFQYCSENVRQILGAPPAPFLIHIVLAVSTISALIIISGRIVNDVNPGRKWEQLAHRGAFYFFYFFSNALGQYFLYVFIAGLAVLVFEHYHIWKHFTSAIRHEKELAKKASLWPLITSSAQK